jgi:hypothetical protein
MELNGIVPRLWTLMYHLHQAESSIQHLTNKNSKTCPYCIAQTPTRPRQRLDNISATALTMNEQH